MACRYSHRFFLFFFLFISYQIFLFVKKEAEKKSCVIVGIVCTMEIVGFTMYIFAIRANSVNESTC